jgi:DNA-binding response OmpR family regulator
MSGSFYPLAIGALEQQVPSARSILCVQPKPERAEFVRLAMAACRVVTASAAVDAIRSMNACPFDAYVLDYWLPDWTGAPLCRELRKRDPHVPIIFYTPAGGEQRASALRAGANAYMEPPCAADVFRDRIAALMQSADAKSLRAKIIVQQTVEQELRRQLTAVCRAGGAIDPSAAARERAAKAKAANVFIDAGGTRASFERFWPRLFAAEWANERITRSAEA